MCLALLLALTLLPCALTQEPYVLNLTAYDSFFTTNCLSSSITCSLTPDPTLCSSLSTSPYPATCNPFSDSSLWIPNGLPGVNSTVNITSDLPIIFVIPKMQTLTKLSLVGAIQFVVEGTLNFTFSKNSSLTPLVVCDTSSFVVRNNGILYTHLAAFFDNSSLVTLNSSSLAIDVVASMGPFASFSFFGDSKISLGNVQPMIYSVRVSDNAAITSQFSLQTQYFALADTASVSTDVFVYVHAVLDGWSYYLQSIKAYNSSSVHIRGCPRIDYIFATQSALVTLLTSNNISSCIVNSIALDTQARIIILGDIDFTLLSLAPGLPHENVTLAFDQLTPGHITNVVLPHSTGPAFLEFNGNYTVVAGEVDYELHVPKPLTISSIVVNGSVNLQVVEIQVGEAFQFVPGLTVTLPANGTLYVTGPFQLAQPQFIWEPYGIVEVDDHGSVTADTFALTDGRILILRNYENVPAAQINNLLVGQGSLLYVRGYQNEFVGSLRLEGELILEPAGGSGYANMTIHGNLSMGDHATLSLPQTLAFDILFPSSWTFMTVLGEVSLDGRLRVAVGGKFPPGFTATNYTRSDIAIMESSTRITKSFSRFTGYLTKSFAAYASGHVALSYRISNEIVYVRLEKPRKSDPTLWFVLGVVGGLLLIAVVVVFAIHYLRRKSQYKKIREGETLTTF